MDTTLRTTALNDICQNIDGAKVRNQSYSCSTVMTFIISLIQNVNTCTLSSQMHTVPYSKPLIFFQMNKLSFGYFVHLWLCSTAFPAWPLPMLWSVWVNRMKEQRSYVKLINNSSLQLHSVNLTLPDLSVWVCIYMCGLSSHTQTLHG